MYANSKLELYSLIESTLNRPDIEVHLEKKIANIIGKCIELYSQKLRAGQGSILVRHSTGLLDRPLSIVRIKIDFGN